MTFLYRYRIISWYFIIFLFLILFSLACSHESDEIKGDTKENTNKNTNKNTKENTKENTNEYVNESTTDLINEKILYPFSSGDTIPNIPIEISLDKETNYNSESFSCVGSGCYVAMLSMFRMKEKHFDKLNERENQDTNKSMDKSIDKPVARLVNAIGERVKWNALMVDPIFYGCKSIKDCTDTGLEFEFPKEVELQSKASAIRVFASEKDYIRPKLAAVKNGYDHIVRADISQFYNLTLVENKTFGWLNTLENVAQGCNERSWPWIKNCGIDAPQIVLSDAIPSFINIRAPKDIVDDSFYIFNQTMFAVIGSGLEEQDGFIYIPDSCEHKNCHIHFHYIHCMKFPGISTSKIKYDRYWHARFSGLNEFAESNNIIVVYPQIASTGINPPNPRACFDYYGFTDHRYNFPTAPQIESILKMKALLRNPAIRKLAIFKKL